MSYPKAFVDELRKVGCEVSEAQGPWDLVNTRMPYRPAVPVLLDWLDRLDEVPQNRTRFRQGLVRSLAVKEARGEAVASRLVREFRRAELDSGTRWAVANSLSVVAEKSVFDDLVVLATDRSYSRSRQMLMDALARSDRSRAGGVLVQMLDDDELVGHAISALGRVGVKALGDVGASDARSAIEMFLDHPRPWVREEAKTVLAKLAT